MEELKRRIREIPDFPTKGILFYDLTTLLRDPSGLALAVDLLTQRYAGSAIDQVVGIESRGFIFAPILAYNLKAGFVPVRKPGKLPHRVVSASYELEYGSDTLEMHRDAVKPGDRVLVVDDLIATGGTAAATVELVQKQGAQITSMAFLVELLKLEGRRKLAGQEVFSLIQY